MKNNIVKYFSFCMLAVAALSFSSCSSDESYDVVGNPNNLVYLDLRGPKTYESKLLSTPVGIFGMAGAFIPVHAQHQTTGLASVTVVDSLVARYNREHKTEYPAFPAEAVKALEITPAQFANNQKDTIQVNVPEDKYALFTEPTYVLPVVLSDVQGGVATEIEDYKIAYVLVNVSTTDDFISITGDKTVKCGIVKTPVGVFGSVSASFGTSIKAAVATDWTNTLEVDNSLIAAYKGEAPESRVVWATGDEAQAWVSMDDFNEEETSLAKFELMERESNLVPADIKLYEVGIGVTSSADMEIDEGYELKSDEFDDELRNLLISIFIFSFISSDASSFSTSAR